MNPAKLGVIDWRIGTAQLTDFANAVLASFDGAPPFVNDQIDRTEIEGLVPVAAINPSTLVAIGTAGHQVKVVIEKDGWEGTLALEGRSAWRIDAMGLDAVLDDLEILDRAEQAAANHDGITVLELLRDATCSLNVALEANPERIGAHWVRTGNALDAALEEPGSWLPTVNRLSMAPSRVVVADAGTAYLSCRGIRLHGPDAEPEGGSLDSGTDVEAYRSVRFGNMSHDEIGDVSGIWPIETVGMARTFDLLRNAVAATAWVWLAERHELEGTTVALTFDGARVVQVDLSKPPQAGDDVLQLWEWATTDTDPARREAIQQAASLALREPGDLGQQARPVLRTARAFFDLGRRQGVTELLAARRAARDAALSSGRAASEAGRATAAKTLDRVIVQLAAGVGLLVAQRNALVETELARILLWLVFGLIVATGLLAVAVDIPSARATVNALGKDLEHYSDVLTTDDEAALNSLPSVASAKEAISRAMWASIVLVVAAEGMMLWVLSSIE